MKYTVDIDFLCAVTYVIEAENEQEARDAAYKIYRSKTEQEIAQEMTLNTDSGQVYQCQEGDLINY